MTTLPASERMDWKGIELEVKALSVDGNDLSSSELGFVDGVTAGTGAASKAMVLDSGEDFTWPATGLLTYGGAAIGATGAEINAAADKSARLVQVADADTYTFLEADSGKVHVFDIMTGDVAIALPAVATVGSGCEYHIMYGAATVVNTDNWVFTNADDAPFAGGLLFLDEDSAGSGADVSTVYADGTDDTMTIVNPAVGTSIHLITNGTLWFVNGQIVSDTVPTFTTTA